MNDEVGGSSYGKMEFGGGAMGIPESEWKWYGVVGHFICGNWCRFHLTTEIGDHLVSTVGGFVHPRHSAGSEQKEAAWLKDNWPGEDIGYQRKYETMVFKKKGGYCTAKGCACGLPAIDASEFDFAGYNTAGEATAGHLELCRKWAEVNVTV